MPLSPAWRPVLFWLALGGGIALAPPRAPARPVSAPVVQRNGAVPDHQGQALLVTFDFGAGGKDSEKVFAVRAAERDSRFGWYGRVRDRVIESGSGGRGFSAVEGDDATFLVGVAPDTLYHVVLVLAGAPQSDTGPIEVLAGDSLVARSDGRTGGAPGRPALYAFDLPSVEGRLEFRLRTRNCGLFELARAQISGPARARLVPLFPGPDRRSPVPPPDSLSGVARISPRDQLERACEYLLDNRPPDGTFSFHGAWYENAFPLRTLLAGAVLLDRPAWRDSAFQVLDRFVAQQAPDGNWSSGYPARAGCGTALPANAGSANLADVGTMALCLSMAAPLADPARRETYLKAAAVYADSVTLPNRLPSGAFPNRLWRGRDEKTPYSIATATQAANLALLYAVTLKAEYRQPAEEAALWLAAHVRQDGRFDYAPNDTALVRTIEAADFGDIYYVMEALSIVAEYSADAATRRQLDAAIERWISGPRGLTATAVHGYWWNPRDLWSASKMAGLPFILSRFAAAGSDSTAPAPPEGRSALALWTSRILAWLADPGLAIRAGVMAHPAGPYGAYALPATGFAGIGFAAMIEPDVLLPPPRDLRLPVAKVDH